MCSVTNAVCPLPSVSLTSEQDPTRLNDFYTLQKMHIYVFLNNPACCQKLLNCGFSVYFWVFNVLAIFIKTPICVNFYQLV
jgi:hypothetical protein